jgi:hypothetical protein
MHACVRAYLFFGRFTGVRRKGQFEGGISCVYPSIRLYPVCIQVRIRGTHHTQWRVEHELQLWINYIAQEGETEHREAEGNQYCA